MFVPPALLYLRLVLGIAAADSRVGPQQSLWLGRSSLAALIVFFVVQLLCARYLQRMFTPNWNTAKNVLLYFAFLIFCVLFSLTAAVTLEAFGLNLFLRTAGLR